MQQPTPYAGRIDADTIGELTEPAEGAVGLPPKAWCSATAPIEWEHARVLAVARDRAAIFRKMRKTSGAVRRGGEALRTAFGETRPVIQSGDQTDDTARELLERQFGLGEWLNAGECKKSLSDILRMCELAIEDGAFFLAPEWKRIDKIWWIVDVHVRHIDSISELYEDSRTGELVGFRQDVDGASEIVWIRDVLYLVYQPELGGPLGFGILRTAYGHWCDEQQGLSLQRVGKRRYAHPNPVATYRDEWRDWILEQMEADADWLEKDQAAVGAHLELYEAAAKGWMFPPPHVQVDFTRTEFDPMVLDAAISADERRIYELLGVGWLHQGRAGSGGARSMVSDQKAHHRAWAAQGVAFIASGLNDQLVGLFYHYNLPGLPRRQWAGIAFEGLEPPKSLEEAQILKIHHDMGGYSAGPEDERAIRESFGKPPMHPDAEALTVFDRRRMSASTTEAGQRSQRQGRDVLSARRSVDAAPEETQIEE